MRKYYGRWIVTAFRHSFSAAEWAGSFVAAWIVPAIKYLTGHDFSMNGELAWQLAVGFAVCLVVLRLALAPYWMYMEDEVKANVVRDERDTLVGQIRFDEARERLRYIRETLLAHADSAQKRHGMIYRPADNPVWIRTAKQMLKDALTPEAGKRFRTFPGVDVDNFEITVNSLRILASDLTVTDLRRNGQQERGSGLMEWTASPRVEAAPPATH